MVNLQAWLTRFSLIMIGCLLCANDEGHIMIGSI